MIATFIIVAICFMIALFGWAIVYGATKDIPWEVRYMEDREPTYTCRNCKYCLITKTATGQDRHKCVINDEVLHTLHPCEVWEKRGVFYQNEKHEV